MGDAFWATGRAFDLFLESYQYVLSWDEGSRTQVNEDLVAPNDSVRKMSPRILWRVGVIRHPRLWRVLALPCGNWK